MFCTFSGTNDALEDRLYSIVLYWCPSPPQAPSPNLQMFPDLEMTIPYHPLPCNPSCPQNLYTYVRNVAPLPGCLFVSVKQDFSPTLTPNLTKGQIKIWLNWGCYPNPPTAPPPTLVGWFFPSSLKLRLVHALPSSRVPWAQIAWQSLGFFKRPKSQGLVQSQRGHTHCWSWSYSLFTQEDPLQIPQWKHLNGCLTCNAYLLELPDVGNWREREERWLGGHCFQEKSRSDVTILVWCSSLGGMLEYHTSAGMLLWVLTRNWWQPDSIVHLN